MAVTPGSVLLSLQDVSVRFGGIVALDGVSFDVERGTILGLIGPNGAGKTTLFNCLSRLYHCDRGEIQFEGKSLLASPSHGISALGIGRTFQNLALFRTLTVLENVMLGGHSGTSGGFFVNSLRLPMVRSQEDSLREQAFDLLRFLNLDKIAQTPVAGLTFPTQKRVELARALAAKPKLLLLDEPAAGLNHEEVSGLGTLICDIRDRLKVTVLLVEHHLNLVMSVSDKVVALDFGKKIAEGTPNEIKNHPDVIRAYLGTGD